MKKNRAGVSDYDSCNKICYTSDCDKDYPPDDYMDDTDILMRIGEILFREGMISYEEEMRIKRRILEG